MCYYLSLYSLSLSLSISLSLSLSLSRSLSLSLPTLTEHVSRREPVTKQAKRAKPADGEYALYHDKMFYDRACERVCVPRYIRRAFLRKTATECAQIKKRLAPHASFILGSSASSRTPSEL